jgi:hypothetical protein
MFPKRGAVKWRYYIFLGRVRLNLRSNSQSQSNSPTHEKKAAAAIRTRPETVVPADVFKSQAVSGPTERPDSRANQPFVQVEDGVQPSIAPHVATVTEFRLSSAPRDRTDLPNTLLCTQS